MEDPFDNIPVPYRAERLGRMRNLIMQIEADYEQYIDLKNRIEEGISIESEREDLHRIEAWLKRNIIAYRRLSAMSIEGVTCAGGAVTSTLSYKNSNFLPVFSRLIKEN